MIKTEIEVLVEKSEFDDGYTISVDAQIHAQVHYFDEVIIHQHSVQLMIGDITSFLTTDPDWINLAVTAIESTFPEAIKRPG